MNKWLVVRTLFRSLRIEWARGILLETLRKKVRYSHRATRWFELVLFSDWTTEIGIYFSTFTKTSEKFLLALRTIPFCSFHLNLMLFCNRWKIFSRLATSFFPLEHVSVPTGALNTGASTRELLQKVNFSLNFTRGCLIFHNRQYSFCSKQVYSFMLYACICFMPR